MDYPRFQISEVHLGKFLDSLDFFLSWKANFKNEVCSKSGSPHLTMHWIKGREIAKSIDHLMMSRSITGRTHFSDYDMLDAMITSALKKLLTSVHFWKRVSVAEWRRNECTSHTQNKQGSTDSQCHLHHHGGKKGDVDKLHATREKTLRGQKNLGLPRSRSA